MKDIHDIRLDLCSFSLRHTEKKKSIGWSPCSQCLAQLRRLTRRPPLYIFLSKDENTLFTNRIEGKAKARVKLQAKSECALILR